MLRKSWLRIRGWMHRRRLDEEFSDEVQAHLDMLADDFERQGMTPRDARLAARRSFGGVEQIREEHREGRGLMHLERLWADLVYAVRTMRRNSAFTLVAVATLALGIGVNVTLFTAFNAVVLKSLAVADPTACTGWSAGLRRVRGAIFSMHSRSRNLCIWGNTIAA